MSVGRANGWAWLIEAVWHRKGERERGRGVYNSIYELSAAQAWQAQFIWQSQVRRKEIMRESRHK